MTREWSLRTIAVVIWSFALFQLAGGQYTYREMLPDGRFNSYAVGMYWRLPPPPKGPAYCRIIGAGSYALNLPCDFKPPFIGWLQGGKY